MADHSNMPSPSVGAAVADPGGTSERIARAEDAFSRGELATAAALLRGCLTDPGAAGAQRAQALSDLAVIAVAQERAHEAEPLLLDALANDPSCAAAAENLGGLCLRRGDLVQASHWFRRLTELAPAEPNGWRHLAETLRGRYRFAEAERVVAQAAGRGHALDPANRGRGVCASPPARRSPPAQVRRVLIVADRFHPSLGGTERLAEAVGSYLLAHGIEVEVATRPMPERERHEHLGMAIHEVSGDIVGQLHALATTGRHDAIVAFSNVTVWPMVATLQLPEPRPWLVVVPCVNAGDDAQLRANPGLMRAYAELIVGADVIGYSSRSSYDIRLCDELGLSGVYVPNAIDRVEAPGTAWPGGGLASSGPLLLMVANLWPGKNHLGMLSALRERPGNWQLGLIGERSPEFPDHAADVARLASLDPRVHLLGGASPPQVADAMEQASVLLLPSLAEATPLVLLEAMSRRLPWIATPTSGAAHDHAGGFVVPLELFGEAIDFLLAHPVQAARLGAAGEAHWRACYTWDVVGPRYLAMVRGEPLPELPPPPEALAETERVRASFYDSRPAAARAA